MRKRKKQQINDKPDYRHSQIKINFRYFAYFKQRHRFPPQVNNKGQEKNSPLDKLVKLARKIPPIMA